MKKISISVIFICFIILFSLSFLGCNDSSKKASTDKAFKETIDEKLNNIINSKDSKTSLSSNPYDYIKGLDSNKDFKYVVSQGEKSLNYMLSKFENSNKDGLEEYIMAIACSEILKENSSSKSWASGRQWYENYLKQKSSNLVRKSISDFPVATTIDKLTSESDIIVVGSYNRFVSNWNTARHPEDFNKEDPNIYVKGALYEFNVDELLNGNNIDKKTITVNVMVSNLGGSVDERYIEPVIGEKVILFLKKSPIADRYFGTMEPYQFSIPDTSNKSYSSDKIKVKTNLKQVQQSFEGGKSFTLDEFKNKINKAK